MEFISKRVLKRVIQIRKLPGLFPLVWEGRTHDDRPIYVRYRHGWLGVYLGEQGQKDVNYEEKELIYRAQIGDGMDSELDYSTLKEWVKNIEWPPNDG